MTTNRTSNMDCLLCYEKPATKTNSHIIPSGILKSNIGNRNYEETYRIAPSDKKPLSSYFGSANLTNKDPEIRQNPHSMDFILCPTCEKALGVWESEINPILSSDIFKVPLGKKYEIIEVVKGASYISCPKINTSVFVLFIYSIIWRMCLQYRLEQNREFMDVKEVEELRQIIYSNLPPKKAELVNVLERITLIIQTCIEPEVNRLANSSIADPRYNEPYCFWINDFVVLISFKGSDSLKKCLGDNNPKLSFLLNDINKTIRIGLADSKGWKKKQEEFAEILADQVILIYATKLSKVTGQNLKEAKDTLNTLAKNIQEQSGMLFGECYIEAYKRVVGA